MLKIPKCKYYQFSMYGGFDVYKTYLIVKLHFASIPTTIISMMVTKSTQNLTRLLKEKADTFFIS